MQRGICEGQIHLRRLQPPRRAPGSAAGAAAAAASCSQPPVGQRPPSRQRAAAAAAASHARRDDILDDYPRDSIPVPEAQAKPDLDAIFARKVNTFANLPPANRGQGLQILTGLLGRFHLQQEGAAQELCMFAKMRDGTSTPRVRQEPGKAMFARRMSLWQGDHHRLLWDSISAPGPAASGHDHALAVDMSVEDIMTAMSTFDRMTAAGYMGLKRPPLLRSLLAADDSGGLKRALKQFVVNCALGNVPAEVLPYLCGACVSPLPRPDGGVRPVAAGEILRRLVAKVLPGPHGCALGLMVGGEVSLREGTDCTQVRGGKEGTWQRQVCT